jgi:hypothetical protein
MVVLAMASKSREGLAPFRRDRHFRMAHRPRSYAKWPRWDDTRAAGPKSAFKNTGQSDGSFEPTIGSATRVRLLALSIFLGALM